MLWRSNSNESIEKYFTFISLSSLALFFSKESVSREAKMMGLVKTLKDTNFVIQVEPEKTVLLSYLLVRPSFS